MLKLQNISKYYSRKGTVALGLRKINLTLGSGEFVAVVGESGSGKSTLLNVISGLDTYEDGEMYINNEETSHYSVEDWENYRSKYIGFVFQNYNIIESYTVLQNVESALILAGYDAKKRRARALEIIDRVGLSEFKNSKTSKLSGGQMQRTVIARALAKDCPIIAADEPTGNLDSETSKQIIDLLYEISKEKLVVIVTHNYDEVKLYATRKITLHDGSVVEDQQLKKDVQVEELPVLKDQDNKVSLYETIMIGIRNITSTPLKTTLMFMVLLMLTLGSALVYGGMLDLKNDSASSNQNRYFTNSAEQRIVIKKQDNTGFTDSELKELENKRSVIEIIKGDVALDQTLRTELPRTYGNEKFRVNTKLMPRPTFDKNDLTAGRMPKAEDEIVINTFAIREGVKAEDILNKTFDYKFQHRFGEKTYKLKVVGISEDRKLGEITYIHSKYFDSISKDAMRLFKKFNYSIQGLENIDFSPRILEEGKKLSSNEIAINKEFVNYYSNLKNIDYESSVKELKGKTVKIKTSSLFETYEKDFVITEVIENEITEEELNRERYDEEFYERRMYEDMHMPRIYFSEEGYYEIIKDKETYQISIMVDSVTKANRLIKDLENSKYKIFYPYGTLGMLPYLLNVAKTVGYTIFLVVFTGCFFFVAYFILRNIMRSKKQDYIILRSIGATKILIKRVVFFEIFIISTLTYITTLLLSILSKKITIKFISKALIQLFKYYRYIDYVYIYLIIILLAFLLNRRFNKKIFSDSVMTTFKGEEGE